MSQKFKLSDMKGGWFIGDFKPNVFHSKDFEVGVKFIPGGTKSDNHYHKITQELTIFITGSATYKGEEYKAGDILLLEPYDENSIFFKEDSHIVCVKHPSVPEDKYYK